MCTDNKSSIRTILKSWIQSAQDPNFAWHHYTTDYDPIDKNNPELDITFDIIKNNPNFKSLNLIIETSSGEGLFRGKMINGRLKAKIDSKLMDHPGWRTRLKIKVINLNLHGSEVIMDQVESDMYYKATLKNGKLNGIVQAYGIVTRDPDGPCADSIDQGLAFIAKYDEGSSSQNWYLITKFLTFHIVKVNLLEQPGDSSLEELGSMGTWIRMEHFLEKIWHTCIKIWN